MRNDIRELCLKCAHPIDNHRISIIGNYEYMEIMCGTRDGDFESDGSCGCDAGFKKVQIKKEFTQMER